MSNQQKFQSVIDKLFDNAIRTFQLSEQGKLLNEKVEQINRDCQTMLTRDEQEFVKECFELLWHISDQQKQNVYREGMLDCVVILKGLGVLA